MNPSISKILIGKPESEAILILQRYGKTWRVVFRDGQEVPNLTPERDDNRYGLVISNGTVSRVMYG